MPELALSGNDLQLTPLHQTQRLSLSLDFDQPRSLEPEGGLWCRVLQGLPAVEGAQGEKACPAGSVGALMVGRLGMGKGV